MKIILILATILWIESCVARKQKVKEEPQKPLYHDYGEGSKVKLV